MAWMPQYDLLRIRINQDESEDTEATKHSVLSGISKVYDPLGLLTPFTVKTNKLMRRIWGMNPKFGWDDVLDSEFQNKWRQIKDEMEGIDTQT